MACSWTSSRLLRACVGVRSGAGVCGRLSARDRVVEDGCKGGRASLGDGGEDAELLPCLLRDLLGEARVDAVHVLGADGVPTSQDGVAEGAQRVVEGALPDEGHLVLVHARDVAVVGADGVAEEGAGGF
jgi:hypothetical protein